jgi:hypothetical protein
MRGNVSDLCQIETTLEEFHGRVSPTKVARKNGKNPPLEVPGS